MYYYDYKQHNHIQFQLIKLVASDLTPYYPGRVVEKSGYKLKCIRIKLQFPTMTGGTCTKADGVQGWDAPANSVT
eukprot:3677755-Rhodomonas_salina.1